MKEPPTKKRKRRSTARRHKTPECLLRANARLLLNLADEMDLIDQSLRCTLDLNVAVSTFRDSATSDESNDPIRGWLKELTRNRTAVLDSIEHFRADILAAPDALIEAARWRVQRVSQLLEVLCNRSGACKEGA